MPAITLLPHKNDGNNILSKPVGDLGFAGIINDIVSNNCTVIVRKKYKFDPKPRFPHGHDGYPSPPLNLRPLNKKHRDLLNSYTEYSRRVNTIRRLYGFGGRKNWLEYIHSLDDDGLSPLTKFTQRVIFDHQFPDPSDCKNKKYIVVVHPENSGLGELTHYIGSVLGRAIEFDRIVIWDTRNSTRRTGWHYFDVGCAGQGELDTLDCLFEPLTSCDYRYSNENNSVYTIGWEDGLDKTEPWHRFHAPSLFTHALLRHASVPLTPTAVKYWWRGQASAFVLRLNSKSLARIRVLRLDPNLHVGFTINKTTGVLESVAVPFPLPPHTFSIHVRHGDKGREMRLIPFQEYAEEAEWFAKQNPNSYYKSAFISSEDPNVFEYARNIARLTFDYGLTSPNENWIWYMSKIKRLNAGPMDQIKAFQNRSTTTLSWILQLFMALECDAYVGTLNSNWNRIIDELRCIWVDHCKQPYLEIGDVVDWSNYHW